MRKKGFSILIAFAFLLGAGSISHAQIIVEGASTWEKSLVPDEFPDISPRITAEYATTIFDTALVSPPDCEGDFDADIDVDGSDLAVFAADFGRTDCGSGESCEGDFDADGDVDGSDLAVFAADFGRTECPYVELVP